MVRFTAIMNPTNDISVDFSKGHNASCIVLCNVQSSEEKIPSLISLQNSCRQICGQFVDKVKLEACSTA